MGINQNSNISISIKELSHLFPFYILLSKDLKLESYGRSMSILFSDEIINESFFENWKFNQPTENENIKNNFDAIIGKLIIISNNKNEKIKFKGQFEKIKTENKYIFLGSPMFNNADQLIENNLTISDFAIHDPISDLLQLLKQNEKSNIELKESLDKVNEQKLKITQNNKQLKLFRNLINNSSDSIQVSDEEGNLIYINNTSSERLGIQIDRCNEYNIRQFETTLSDVNDWNKHVEELKKSTQLLIEGENINILTGEKFYVEVFVNYFQIDQKGYIIANSRDITVRKKNEYQLKLQEEKYQNIIANMNLGLLEVDLNENIEFCNQSFTDISGYTLEELKGKNAASLFIDQNNLPSSIEINKKREQGVSDGYELLVLNKQKEYKWWLISGSPKYDNSGKMIGSIGIHLDITNQKKLKKELESALASAKAASIAKEAFLANMSHEIRTPLNGIIGMISQLNKEKISSQQLAYVTSAQTASDHLLSIVNNILDISKIEAEELKLETKETDLKKLLADVVKIIENQLIEKKLFLTLTTDPKIKSNLIIDESRLRQILINIIGNAIKFTKIGGVTIECNQLKLSKKTQSIEILIKDTGIGMNASFIQNIYTKFNQEDVSSSRRYGGTGLGMAISKQLIELMNGSIELVSEKNIGTEVKLKLKFPISEKNQEIIDKNNEITSSLKNIKILIVEDNEMNRLVITNLLKIYEPKITEAENGKMALEILKNSDFDLILMDLQMPIMGGLETTKIIRKNRLSNAPIIAISANAFQSKIDKCLNEGMNGYITKPCKEEKFIRVINEVITKHKETLNLSNEKLYDLSILKEISRGDTEFIMKMLNLFIKEMPLNIAKVNIAIKEKKYNDVKKIAHKIKPMVDNLKIINLKEKILKIESFNVLQKNKKEFESLILDVVSILSEVCNQIQQNELNKKAFIEK